MEPSTQIPQQPINNQSPIGSPIANTPTQPEVEPKKKKSGAGIIVAIIVILILGAIGFGIYSFINNILSSPSDDSVSVKHDVPVEKFTSQQKITIDYEAGAITKKDYLEQLIYSNFDNSKLRNEYKSDTKTYQPANYELILNQVKEDPELISKDALKLLAYYTTGANLKFEIDDEVSSNNSVRLAADSTPIDNLKDSIFNKVIVSKNEKCIVWYTAEGKNSVTKETAQSIADEFESTIQKYSDYFGYPYSVSLNSTDINRSYKKLLKKNGYDPSLPDRVMSIYIYDMGDEQANTGAAYMRSSNLDWLINHFINWDIINIPYIVVNSRALNADKDDAYQIINHEIFHHWQNALICKTGCDNADSLNEAMANVASIIVSDKGKYIPKYHGDDYVKYLNKSFKARKDYFAYIQYPFMYSWLQTSGNWKNYLEEFSNSPDQIKFLSEHDNGDMKKALNYNAEHLFLKDDKNHLMNELRNVSIEDLPITIGKEKSEIDVQPGAVEYFKLTNKNKLTIAAKDGADYLDATIYCVVKDDYRKIHQYKGGILEAELTGEYDECYMYVLNADLLNIHTFAYTYNPDEEINLGQTFRTSWRNYTVQIDLSMNMFGLAMNTTSKGVVDEYHQREHLNVTAGSSIIDALDVETEMYVDVHNGISYTKVPFSDIANMFDAGVPEWIKDKSDSVAVVDIAKIQEFFKDESKYSKNSDGSYTLKMNAKDAAGILSTSDSSKNLKAKGEFEVTAYIKNGRINKLIYDLSKVVGSDTKATITFSNYNNSGDVVIPFSITENAREPSNN